MKDYFRTLSMNRRPREVDMDRKSEIQRRDSFGENIILQIKKDYGINMW